MRGRVLLVAVVMALGPAAIWAKAPLQPIERLDVPRYLGTWHEIAKLPNFFQRKCVSDTRAEYAPNTDGTLKVTNRCRTASGETIEAVGAARQMGDAASPKLRVRFAPPWLAWLPLVWGDYWVIDLDADYQLAAVSEPGREYLWVLSRSPRVEPARYEALLKRLAAQGLDISKLEVTTQTAGKP